MQALVPGKIQNLCGEILEETVNVRSIKVWEYFYFSKDERLLSYSCLCRFVEADFVPFFSNSNLLIHEQLCSLIKKLSLLKNQFFFQQVIKQGNRTQWHWECSLFSTLFFGKEGGTEDNFSTLKSESLWTVEVSHSRMQFLVIHFDIDLMCWYDIWNLSLILNVYQNIYTEGCKL